MLIVQKFGGTSVADVIRIQAAAKRVLDTHRAGHEVAVVVSAMAGETNRLLKMAGEMWDDTRDREVDLIISTGEQITAGLMALAIRDLGGNARSFLGHQIKIVTDSDFSRARIADIDIEILQDCFNRGRIAVIAGFQGVDDEGNITTLGRGGSDTTAVAIAAALKADVCEIYTDVEGIFTADPNVVPTARKIERISYEEMIELASLGAKVLQLRSVEFGMKYNVPIHVRSSFSQAEGTWVVREEETMEQVVVSGITIARDEAKISVRGLPDAAGTAFKLFSPLSEANVMVDMIVQNPSTAGKTDITFTVPRGDRKRAIEVLSDRLTDLPEVGKSISSDESIAKVSIVGVGMRSHSGVARKMFEILGKEGINILMISTSEIKISCLIGEKYAELAMRALHDGFGLHLAPPERAKVQLGS